MPFFTLQELIEQIKSEKATQVDLGNLGNIVLPIILYADQSKTNMMASAIARGDVLLGGHKKISASSLQENTIRFISSECEWFSKAQKIPGNNYKPNPSSTTYKTSSIYATGTNFYETCITYDGKVDNVSYGEKNKYYFYGWLNEHQFAFSQWHYKSSSAYYPPYTYSRDDCNPKTVNLVLESYESIKIYDINQNKIIKTYNINTNSTENQSGVLRFLVNNHVIFIYYKGNNNVVDLTLHRWDYLTDNHEEIDLLELVDSSKPKNIIKKFVSGSSEYTYYRVFVERLNDKSKILLTYDIEKGADRIGLDRYWGDSGNSKTKRQSFFYDILQKNLYDFAQVEFEQRYSKGNKTDNHYYYNGGADYKLYVLSSRFVIYFNRTITVYDESTAKELAKFVIPDRIWSEEIDDPMDKDIKVSFGSLPDVIQFLTIIDNHFVVSINSTDYHFSLDSGDFLYKQNKPPAQAAAARPSGNMTCSNQLYTVNYRGDFLSVIDNATQSCIRTLKISNKAQLSTLFNNPIIEMDAEGNQLLKMPLVTQYTSYKPDQPINTIKLELNNNRLYFHVNNDYMTAYCDNFLPSLNSQQIMSVLEELSFNSSVTTLSLAGIALATNVQLLDKVLQIASSRLNIKQINLKDTGITPKIKHDLIDYIKQNVSRFILPSEFFENYASSLSSKRSPNSSQAPVLPTRVLPSIPASKNKLSVAKGSAALLPSSNTPKLDTIALPPKKAAFVPLKEPNLIEQFDKLNISFSIPYHELKLDGKELGRGGFGVVYKGEFNYSPVAVKQLLNQSLNQEALEEFQREAHIMAQLRSPYTVQLYGACLEAPHYALVMEYMPQGSLYNLLQSSQEINWSVRYQIGVDISCGLAYLHKQGIIHGDVKSLNVLLDSQYRAKVADFGMAKVKITSSAVTALGLSKGGTERWMAPELLLEEGAKNSKPSDVYSFGMVLWELGSRMIPFEKKAPRVEQYMMQIFQGKKEDIASETPPKMAHLIKQCWNKRAKRPTIDEAVQVLREEYKSYMVELPPALPQASSISNSTLRETSNSAEKTAYPADKLRQHLQGLLAKKVSQPPAKQPALPIGKQEKPHINQVLKP